MFKLNPIFANEMILQANKPVYIYGEGDGEISVTLGNNSVTTSAKDGKWVAKLPCHTYGEILEMTVQCGDIIVTVSEIAFGDVYLISGQSNMQFKLFEAIPDGEIYESSDIRFFSTKRMEENEKFTPLDGWVKCDAKTALNFSALGYFIAKELHAKNNYPIGLVGLYQGASVIQSWLSPKALGELESVLPTTELHGDHTHPLFSLWNKSSTLYDFAFSQIVPFSFASVIWYQGESNTSKSESNVYDILLSKLVLSWREALRDESLPFVIVQIADYIPRSDDEWSCVQKMQEKAASELPYTYLAKSSDICENDNIHPPTKHILAKRIASFL